MLNKHWCLCWAFFHSWKIFCNLGKFCFLISTNIWRYQQTMVLLNGCFFSMNYNLPNSNKTGKVLFQQGKSAQKFIKIEIVHSCPFLCKNNNWFQLLSHVRSYLQLVLNCAKRTFRKLTSNSLIVFSFLLLELFFWDNFTFSNINAAGV